MGTEKVWLITGASSGLGHALAEAVIARGDRLMATARNVAALEALKAAAPERVHTALLDITQPDQIASVVRSTCDIFGRIDVLVNNAGYGLVGALEEFSEQQIRANVETNFFGPIAMMRAVLPVMRAQRAGHIINISAIAGISNEMGFSIYGGSKFGIEGVSEAVAAEVAPLGIKVTLIEPGPFRTAFIGKAMLQAVQPISDYDGTSGKFARMLATIAGKQLGDPAKAAEAIIQITEVPQPPLRLPLGRYACEKLRKKLKSLEAELDTWEHIGKPTDFVPGRS